MPRLLRLPRKSYRAGVPPHVAKTMRPRRTARCGGPLRFSVLSGQVEAAQTVPCRSMFHYVRPHDATVQTLVNVSAGFRVVAVSGARCRCALSQSALLLLASFLELSTYASALAKFAAASTNRPAPLLNRLRRIVDTFRVLFSLFHCSLPPSRQSLLALIRWPIR